MRCLVVNIPHAGRYFTMIKDINRQNGTVAGNERTLEVLHRDFPQCFTPEGLFDIGVFRSLLDGAVPVTREGYSLQFLGKGYATLVASTDTTTVIRPDDEHNSRPENRDSRNIYITGDNLDALKHLRNSYAGAVKCIYIDPPYNTGSDGFVYNDRFGYTSVQLQERLGISAEEAGRILEMTTRGSASHSAWLAFMFPRLLLARDMLTPDGVIFISIDDNEQANLKLLCDTVYGEENFIAQMVWKSKSGGANDTATIGTDHEYVLVYSMDGSNVVFNKDKYARVSTQYNREDARGRYALDRLDKQNLGYSESLDFPITGPDGRTYVVEHKDPAQKHARWRWSKSTVSERYDELVFKYPYVYTKNYEKDCGLVARSLLTEDRFGRTRTGSTDLGALFDERVFAYPKPVALIRHLISLVTSDDDIVMDFFSGSATTAQAVMQLNAMEKYGHRRFILVQCPEETKRDSEARKAGYHTIDEIGQERIRRAAKKLKDEDPKHTGDVGFKHFTLVEPDDRTFAMLEEFDPNVVIGAHNILDQFGLATVLRTWAVRDGYGLDAEFTPVDLCGYVAYLCGRHLYFVEPGLISGDEVRSIVALIDLYGSEKDFKPENVVLFGYSFTYTETEALKKNLLPLRDGIKNLRVNLDIRY